MAKLLIGWLALNNDLIKPDPTKGIERAANIDGPNYQIHKHFYEEYEKHILLYSAETHEPAVMMLINKIQQDFPSHQIIPMYIPLKSVIDIHEIKQKIEALLLDQRNEEVDIFFSPGTSAMQVSWYICHSTLGLKSRLLQTIPGSKSKSGNPEMLEIEVEQSEYPVSVVIRQQNLDGENPDPELPNITLTESMEPILERAYQLAQTDKVTTLITGETGTGKGLIAKYIWKNSPRKDNPFDTINCSALGDELLESRLFGYKKGSFTGAEQDKDGLLKSLDGGTIFLDEIGDISARLQQSLLRFLQEGEIQPIGGISEKVNVRVISATNKDLHAMCEEGNFRWDLYYRLMVADIYIPSLRTRGAHEVEYIFLELLDLKKKELQKKIKIKPDREVVQFVKSYTWPGNVRELENFVEYLYVFCNETATMKDVPPRLFGSQEPTSLKIKDIEAAHIRKVLKMKKGNQRQTAIAIGWVINTLKNKMKEYEIDPEEYQ
jgi:DNA-binding NtrC family response regulator